MSPCLTVWSIPVANIYHGRCRQVSQTLFAGAGRCQALVWLVVDMHTHIHTKGNTLTKYLHATTQPTAGVGRCGQNFWHV